MFRINSLRSLLWISFSLIGLCNTSLKAAPRDFGVGITLGSPSGLSLWQNLDSTSAIQAALEYNVVNPFVAQADYLFKIDGLFPLEKNAGKLFLYYGPGFRMEFGKRESFFFGPYRVSDKTRGALRFPVGLQYYIPKIPFDVFTEVAPMLSLWPATVIDMTIALGIRYDL